MGFNLAFKELIVIRAIRRICSKLVTEKVIYSCATNFAYYSISVVKKMKMPHTIIHTSSLQ
jgi:hypothetical protein